MQQSFLPQFPNQSNAQYHHPHQIPIHNFQPQPSQHLYSTQLHQMGPQNIKTDQAASRFYKRQPVILWSIFFEFLQILI